MNFIYKNKNIQKLTSIEDERLITPDLESLASQNKSWHVSSGIVPLVYDNKVLFPHKKSETKGRENIYYFISDLFSNSRYIIVLKVLKNDDLSECVSCEIVNNMSQLCKKVIIHNVDLDSNAIIMPFFDGDVSKLVKENDIDDEDRLIVVKTLLDAILCLRNKGAYYSDIKIEQMLYKYNGDELIVKLGDLAVTFEDEKGTICSYRSPTYNPRGKALEYDMVWSVGAFILQLYGDIKGMFWNSNKDVEKEGWKYYNKFSSKAKNKFLFNIVYDILQSDPDDYITLLDIQKIIDKKMDDIGLELANDDE